MSPKSNFFMLSGSAAVMGFISAMYVNGNHQSMVGAENAKIPSYSPRLKQQEADKDKKFSLYVK